MNKRSLSLYLLQFDENLVIVIIFFLFLYKCNINFFYIKTTNQRNIKKSTSTHLNQIKMKIICEHISSNCNAMPESFDFLTDDIIAYCYKNQVGLYSLPLSYVYRNLHGISQTNASRANCIKCFTKKNLYFIVVGYDNGSILVYSSQNKQDWKQTQAIKQKSNILSLAFHQNYLAVNNNDSLVTIYKISDHFEFQFLAQIQFPLNKTIQSTALQLVDDFLVVFLGGVDNYIYCYSIKLQQQQKQLTYQFSLTGHQNSITKLTITNQNQSFFLASSSKDGYIRLWKITKNLQQAKFHKSIQNLNLTKSYLVFLDSVLISHQCSITNLNWADFKKGKKQLLSSSLDCTICIWSQNQQDKSWSVESRMGQFLGNKNAYFSIKSNSAGTYLAALNYIGSLLIWKYDLDSNKFVLRQSTNGHFFKVTDICWNYSGDFLVSVSKDQTTRVLAQNRNTHRYHQISRAQIHGYDINTVCLLKTKQKTFDVIACGADQKVIRIFQPPACFANYFNSFTLKNFHLFFNTVEQQQKYIFKKQKQCQPLLYDTYTQGGAQVLGLMTKVQRIQRQKVVDYYNDEQEQTQQVQEQKIDLKQTKRIDFQKPPHDDYLVKHTLWPQMNKLYGHPHQLQCLCKNSDSKLMASSCKALTKQASSIIIWNTQQWKIHKIINHHSYTVYSMEFSKNDKYFASVSKDRKLAVFDRDFEVLFSYEAHSRAISDVSISSDERFVITSSRDRSVKLHSIEDKKCVSQYQFTQIVTAVSFCMKEGKESIVCCGLGNGKVMFLRINQNKEFEVIGQIEQKYSHTQKINRIRWNGNKVATCSDDHSVGIFKIQEW